MPPRYTDQELANFAAEQLVNFKDDFVLASIEKTDDRLVQWVELVGELGTVDSPVTKYPIASGGATFAETRDGNRAESLGLGGIDLRTVEYDAGYEMPLLDLIMVPAMQRAWDAASGGLVEDARRFHAKAIATLLNSGTSTVSEVDGVELFSTTHPYTDGATSGTWSNYNSSGLAVTTVANILTAIAAMQANARRANGDRVSVGPYAVMVPLALGMKTAAALAQANLASGESNPLAPYNVQVIVNPYLDALDANDWYVIDLSVAAKMPAFIGVTLDPGSALSLRQFGTESDYFKSTGKIKNNLHVWQGAALAFPQGIYRQAGA